MQAFRLPRLDRGDVHVGQGVGDGVSFTFRVVESGVVGIKLTVCLVYQIILHWHTGTCIFLPVLSQLADGVLVGDQIALIIEPNTRQISNRLRPIIGLTERYNFDMSVAFQYNIVNI